MKIRYFFISFGVIAAIGFIGMVSWYALNLRPADASNDQAVSFVLKQGTDVDQLSSDLANAGLIRSQAVFIFYVTVRGDRGELQAGAYEIAPSESVPEIVGKIVEGRVSVNKVVLPEGITTFQVSKLLEEKGVSKADFASALKEDYDYDFVKAIPKDVGLEGYLFPDTYEIVKPVRSRAIVQNMLNNFAKKVQEAGVAKGFSSQGLTFHQGVTLASIVEREVKSEVDRAMVAQLYINRIKSRMPLQADPTAIYGAELVGKKLEPVAAVAFDSPYNTYKIAGLPPGPIGNPGVSAMKAVANPTPNDYLYFLSGKDGKTHYAKTLKEHENNINKYLR